MPHLDLSYEGRQQAERGQLDNGKLPHGGYRGCRKHPLMYMSFDKGKDFEDLVNQEVARVLEEEELSRYGYTPSWSLLLHKHPSYTDESVLMRHELLSANKFQQTSSYDLFDPVLSESNKFRRGVHYNGTQYYRPNRTHQYLTTTELRNFAQEDVNIKYGRPTRTTLLRARQRSNSAPQERREFLHHLEDIRHSVVINSNPPYLNLQDLREGESLHSYLTGARYNRSHCLDSKSVDHSGVYMPRLNPALGCFFSGPKGLWYMENLRQDLNLAGYRDDQIPVPPPASPRLQEVKPQSAPSRDVRIPAINGATAQYREEQTLISNKPERVKNKLTNRSLELHPTGNQLFINGIKLPSIVSPRKILNTGHELNQKQNQPNSVKTVVKDSEVTNIDVAKDNEDKKIAVAKDNEDKKIAVEMNQVLAPVLTGPTLSLVTEDTDVTSHIKERAKGETSTVPEIAGMTQDDHRKLSEEGVSSNEKTGEVKEDGGLSSNEKTGEIKEESGVYESRFKQTMENVGVNEGDIKGDDQTERRSEDGERLDNLKVTTDNELTDDKENRAEEDPESEVTGQLAGQETTELVLDDHKKTTELVLDDHQETTELVLDDHHDVEDNDLLEVEDDGRDAAGVSGEVTFFITEHDREDNVTQDGV